LFAIVPGAIAAQPPKPYTPVTASSSQFCCLGRSVQLGLLLLPEQIVAANQPLLAGPVRVVTEPNVLAAVKGEARVIGNTGDRATWQWTGESPELHIRASVSGDCDGFCWYDVELAPKQPLKLSAIRVEIPRLASTARYLHTANFTWTHFSQGLPEAGAKWSGSFMPYVWLGDEERGLAWCAESSQGWMIKDPAHALEVQTQGGVVRFQANLLDHEEVISHPLTIRFGLQASPVKPVSFAWRAKARIMHDVNFNYCQPGKDGRMRLDTLHEAGVKTVVFHDCWTDYYGKITTPYGEHLGQLISECHKRDMKLLVYVGYGLARQAPELQGHHDAWSVIPLMPWTTSYRREFREFDATCARSGWADWLVKGIDRLFTDYQLDGLYFDGTSVAWRCQNQSHGCGWKDGAGHLQVEYPLLAVRQLMRRIADTVHRHRPEAILDAHMSGMLTLPTISFCDSYWNGEQFEDYTAKNKFELPLHAFRTEFMGYAHGLDAEFLCYPNRPFTMEEAITLAWLHGVEVRPNSDTLPQVSTIWHAMDKFGTASATWLPYWAGSGAVAEEASVKISAYVKTGRALLFISHLKREPAQCRVRLDRRRLGLVAGELSAVDAITGAGVALEGDTLPLSFAGMTYRLVEVGSRQVAEKIGPRQ
jgi:hypothetical protein